MAVGETNVIKMAVGETRAGQMEVGGPPPMSKSTCLDYGDG